jgi:hypothetical protein
MRLISLLNQYRHFPGFVYEKARHCAAGQTVEIAVRLRCGSKPVCSGCHKPGGPAGRFGIRHRPPVGTARLPAAPHPSGPLRRGAGMTAEHPFAGFVRALGKGPKTARPLTRAEARAAFGMVMADAISPVQLGAFLTLVRVMTETAEELAGFAEAARTTLAAPRDAPFVAVDCSARRRSRCSRAKAARPSGGRTNLATSSASAATRPGRC